MQISWPWGNRCDGWQRAILGRYPRWTLLRAGLLLGLCFAISKYVLVPVRVTGISMAPSYRDGSINLINRLAYTRGKEPHRGDVVLIRTTGLSVVLMKRIVGLPGETVFIRNSTVYVDGKPLKEPYVIKTGGYHPDSWNLPPTTLKSGQYLAIGDNRTMDQDFHLFGVFPREKIVGKAIW